MDKIFLPPKGGMTESLRTTDVTTGRFDLLLTETRLLQVGQKFTFKFYYHLLLDSVFLFWSHSFSCRMRPAVFSLVQHWQPLDKIIMSQSSPKGFPSFCSN